MVNQNESFFIFKVALCVICLFFLSIPAHSYGQADVSNDETSGKTILTAVTPLSKIMFERFGQKKSKHF